MPSLADIQGGIRTPFMNPRLPRGNPMGYTGMGQGLAQLAARPAGWTPSEEQAFRLWMNQRAAESGVSANADSPLHAYNYRGLFRSGQGLAMDSSDNQLHGSSQFKADEHPNRFVIHEGRLIDSRTGRPVGALEALSELYGKRR